MSNTRENRIKKYLRETMPRVEKHIGHKAELRYPKGATGIIERFSIDDGHIKAWINTGGKFHTPFFIEELKECLTCLEKEANA